MASPLRDSDRFLPDKAIDVIDEASAKREASAAGSTPPSELRELIAEGLEEPCVGQKDHGHRGPATSSTADELREQGGAPRAPALEEQLRNRLGRVRARGTTSSRSSPRMMSYP